MEHDDLVAAISAVTNPELKAALDTLLRFASPDGQDDRNDYSTSVHEDEETCVGISLMVYRY